MRRFLLPLTLPVAVTFVWLGCGEEDPAIPNALGSDGGGGGNTDGGSTTEGGGGGGDPDAAGGGEAGPAGTVSITYGSCEAFTKCGGALVGSWKVTGGCLGPETLAPVKAQCPTLKESDVTIRASGTLDITATNVKRNTTTDVSAKLLVPKSCVQIPSCAAVEFGLRAGVGGGPRFETAKCADVGASCDCAVAVKLTETSDETYTVNDGVLTTAADRTYEHCVQGNKLRYRETTNNTPLVLTVEMSK